MNRQATHTQPNSTEAITADMMSWQGVQTCSYHSKLARRSAGPARSAYLYSTEDRVRSATIFCGELWLADNQNTDLITGTHTHT